MERFYYSKYKNAFFCVPKPEECIKNICVDFSQNNSHNIVCSKLFKGFISKKSSNVSILRQCELGKQSAIVPFINVKSDVTDLDFNPFMPNILATSSRDKMVKIWQIPECGLKDFIEEPSHSFINDDPICNLKFNPAVVNLLTICHGKSVALYDVQENKQIFESNKEYSDMIYSSSWHRNGSLLATSAKDKNITVLDFRDSVAAYYFYSGHNNMKDLKVVWLSNSNYLLSTGFDERNTRQMALHDLRFSKDPVIKEYDISSAIKIALYDYQTEMIFVYAKGDCSMTHVEIQNYTHFLECSKYIDKTGTPIRGACLMPKECLAEDVVNCIEILTPNSIVPIKYKTGNRIAEEEYPKQSIRIVDWPFIKNNGLEIAENNQGKPLLKIIQKPENEPKKKKSPESTVIKKRAKKILPTKSQPNRKKQESVKPTAVEKRGLRSKLRRKSEKQKNPQPRSDEHRVIILPTKSQPNRKKQESVKPTAVDKRGLRSKLRRKSEKQKSPKPRSDEKRVSKIVRSKPKNKSEKQKTNKNKVKGDFICSLCGDNFTTNSSLKRHSIRIHSDARPFKCDLCPKTFKHRDDINQHKIKGHRN